NTNGNNAEFGTVSGGGNLTKSGAGNLTVGGTGVTLGNLVVSAGSMTVKARSGSPNFAASNRVVRVTSLNLGAPGGSENQLDMNDNDLIVDYSGTSPWSTIYAYVQDGYGGTNGLTSTVRDTSGSATTLVPIDNNDIGGAYTEWPIGSGQTID